MKTFYQLLMSLLPIVSKDANSNFFELMDSDDNSYLDSGCLNYFLHEMKDFNSSLVEESWPIIGTGNSILGYGVRIKEKQI